MDRLTSILRHVAIGPLLAGLAAMVVATALVVLPGLQSGLAGLSINTLFWLRDHSFGQRRVARESPVAVILIGEVTHNTPPFQGLSKELWTPQFVTILRAVNNAAPHAVGLDFVLPTSMESIQPALNAISAVP